MTVNITPAIVAAARNLIKNGTSRREAAALLGVSRSGLSDALVRKRIRKETRGRPRKLNKTDMANIRKLRESLKKQGRDPVSSFILLKLGLNRAQRGKRKVSQRSVQRAIGADGDKYLHRKKKGTLTKADMKVRETWGVEAENTDWAEVDLWVDCHKCSMPLPTTPLRSGMSWRKPSEGNESWAVKGHPKFIAPGSKLFGGFGGGKLLFLKSYEKFNKVSCTGIFKKTIIPALRRKYGDRRYLVMCDGDGTFRSKMFEQYCDEAGIDLIDWPPYSGDLAPMENVWAEGDRRLVLKIGANKTWRSGKKVNKANLKAWDKTVHATFRQIPSSFYDAAVNGMEARVADMVQRKGGRVPK
jgi:transposase